MILKTDQKNYQNKLAIGCCTFGNSYHLDLIISLIMHKQITIMEKVKKK